MEIKSRKNAVAAALCTGVAGNVIWGSSYLFTRIAQNESSPMVQLAWRFVLAFLLLNLMILFGWEKLRLRGKKLRPLLLLTVTEPLYFFCESYGIYYSNSTFSGVMLAIVPIIAMGLGALILKEYPTGKQVLLCLLPVAGVVLVTIAGSRMGAVQPLGVLLVLGACLFAAFYRVYNKGAAVEFSAFERSYFVIGMCAVVFVTVALCSTRGDLAPFAAALHSWKFVMATIFLSVFCSVAANILVNYSASVLPMAIFSSLGSLITACAMFLGVIFLKEPVNAMSFIGSGLVLLGLFLIARTNHALQREDQTAPEQDSPESNNSSGR